MTIFNIYKQDGSPLYLGEDLGLQQYIKPRYPQLYSLFKDQRANHWVETQIDLSEDQKQWEKLSDETKQITILNLSNQIMMDSVLGRSPLRSLAPFVSNEEFEIMLIEWQRVEATLHSVTYTHIIQSVFPSPDEVLEEIKTNTKALKRLDNIRRLFDNLYELSVRKQHDELNGIEWTQEQITELKCEIIKTHFAIYFLESNQFNASFAMTFSLGEQDILSGIAGLLKYIARDELDRHTDMSEAILDILREEWKTEYALVEPDILSLFEDVLQGEVEWAEYVFSEGRKVVGLNPVLLKEYLYFIGANSLRRAQLPVPDYLDVRENPIPWIENWIDIGRIQVAPQEQEITNYRIGSYDSNVDIEELDMDF